jgi:hypothetical protein
VSKKSTKQPRISKREQRRLQIEREKRMRALRIWVPIGVVVIGFIALIIFRSNEGEIEGVESFPSAIGNQHDSTLQIAFGGLPPTGGPHNPTWQNCGIYLEPVQPQYAIHSMEHGAVWITYHPDLPADQIASLQDTVRGQSHIILSPYPDQEAQIVLTVWDRQLQVDSASDERIEAFISEYRTRRGPEAGGTCSNGTGNPITQG